MSDILKRRETHFVLWCSETPNRPELIIGRLKNGNPPVFQLLKRVLFQPAEGISGLWEIDASTIGLTSGRVYHYWFEVDNTQDLSQRIQVTDPLAYGVDYRLYAPANPIFIHPASVIGWTRGKLVACDPNGERGKPVVVPFEKLPTNNQMVIYELPTAWVRTFGYDEFERGVGTFRDILSLVEAKAESGNFPELTVTQDGHQYLPGLGVNAIQLLPPADSIYSREWGYGTSHYLAPDYELGYPDGHLSPTPNRDLTALVNACHRQGIRIILDVVLGFMKDEPYRHIDFHSFYLESPEKHPDDPNAYSSRDKPGGGKELRNSFFASSPRYIQSINMYDPVSGEVKDIAPIRQHMLTFLTRWMKDFHIDGIRMDSVENVANWDFIKTFRDEGYKQFRERYPKAGDAADEKFIVVGEELSMPLALLFQKRLDGLWNEHFQGFVRAAILGENAGSLGEPSFEWTVRRAIDCRLNGLLGTQAINYITSHDVEGERKERLYTMLESAITLANSGSLFNRSSLEAEVREEIKREGGNPFDDNQVRLRTDGKIVHRARLRRIKLAFVCQLTSVGIPMILAGEEFGDQHDLFDKGGHITHRGGKQVEPVNYSRAYEPDRRELFEYVARLVKLRTKHPGLSVDDTTFIHTDFTNGKRVLVWKRGTTDPVVVVANFSDFATPQVPNAEYRTPNWPATPAGHHWFEVTQSRQITDGSHDKEPIFAWEAKVYHLVPDAV